MKLFVALSLLATLAAAPAFAKKMPKDPPKRNPASAKFISTYTSVNDQKTCSYQEEMNSSSEIVGCTYRCAGPAEGLGTELYTCNDYDHFYVVLSGKKYSTWGQMASVGGFGALGNEKGLVEWIARNEGHAVKDPIAMIVRFSGQKDDGSFKINSRLAVYGIEGSSICFKGLAKDNVTARQLAYTGACKEKLSAEAE
jgi:hypothetical protein